MRWFQTIIVSMVREIVKIGDPVLSEICTPVEKFDDELITLVTDMFETLEKSGGVGLAGPQVGVPKRLFVVLIDDRVREVFINPEIIETSADYWQYEEGCLSVPGIYKTLKRPKTVKIQAQDLAGKKFQITATDLYGRVIFHENDHLDGKLFIDRVNAVERALLLKRYENLQEKAKSQQKKKKK